MLVSTAKAKVLEKLRSNQGQDDTKMDVRLRKRGGIREGSGWREGGGGDEANTKRRLRPKRSQGIEEAKAKKRAQQRG